MIGEANDLAALVRARGAHVLDGVTDFDELLEVAVETTRSHGLIPRSTPFTVDAQMHALASGRLAFNRLRYGGDVAAFSTDADPTAFLVVLTLAGKARLTYGADSTLVSGSDTVVIAPYRAFRSDIDADFDQVIVSIPRERLEAVAARHLLNEPGTELELALTGFPLAAGVARLFEALILLNDDASGDPGVRDRLEDAALENLLHSIPSFRAQLPESAGAASPRVRTAIHYMLERLGEPLTVAEVAAAVGVTPRALQAAFRRDLDESPLLWLRARRLERAYRLLLATSPPAESVTTVASACGFFHAGEFAMAFRARFGRTPSSVLREARRTVGIRESDTDGAFLR